MLRPTLRRPWIYRRADLITAAALLLDAGRRPKMWGICPSKHWAVVVITHGEQSDGPGSASDG